MKYCVFEGAIADEISMMPNPPHATNAPPTKSYQYDAPDSICKPVSIHSVIKEVFVGGVRANAADRGARVRGGTKSGFAVRESSPSAVCEGPGLGASVGLLFALVITTSGVAIALLVPETSTIGSVESTEIVPERLGAAQVAGSIALLQLQGDERLSWQPATHVFGMRC